VESAGAGQAAAESEEAGVDVAASFVAGGEPSEGMQRGEGVLNDPAPASEAGAVLGLAASDEPYRLAIVCGERGIVELEVQALAIRGRAMVASRRGFWAFITAEETHTARPTIDSPP
jgi:hypothetical protein